MDFDWNSAMYNNKVDIWAMGCILYELATGARAFTTDHAVSLYFLSHENKDVVLANTFDSGSIKTIRKHIVDMLRIDPSDRPSASFLSEEFNRQLQLAQQSVLLSTAGDSATSMGKSESFQHDNDKFVLVSQQEPPLHLAEEYPLNVCSPKSFR